jgi:hypothetical protein
MTFEIYTDSGGNFNSPGPLWAEHHTAVNVDSGSFSIVLGSQNPIPDTVFTGDQRWLQVVVNGEPVQPRTMLTSVPYSARAGGVDGFSPGPLNVDSGVYNFIAGDSQIVLGDYSSISGGYANQVFDDYSFVGGGRGNIAGALTGVSGSNDFNKMAAARGDGSAVCVGGEGNEARADFSSIIGGEGNTISETGIHSTIAGGKSNYISEPASTIAGGERNIAGSLGSHSFVGGGLDNQAHSDFTVICGGNENNTSSAYANIGGGRLNTAC